MSKTDIILLAAGNSERFGKENKLLTKIDEKPMFTYAINIALEARKKLNNLVGKIVVVSKYQEIEEYVQKHNGIGYEKNNCSENGISESIHIGINATYKDHAALFFVCDQPWLKPQTLCRLIELFAESQKRAGAVTDMHANIGNPCIFAPDMRQELLKLTGDTGGKSILKKLPREDCLFILADGIELIDIDKH